MNHSSQSSPVAIPRSHKKVMYSRGREYHIFISLPAGPPPPDGFPVIYVLDANSVFGTITEAVRAQSRFPERTGVYPAIIAGIGYPTDAPFHPARHYDFTQPVPRSELPPSPDGSEWPEQGGAEAFLSFIEEELKPVMAEEFPVNSGQSTLFGHSLGGLFVLFALFTRPGSFQTYVAGSPSISWNEQALLEREQRFCELWSQDKPVRLMLSAGELERSHESGVNSKAKALADRLTALGQDGLSVQYNEFANENHMSVLPVLVSRAIRFAAK
jgi:predicted alpha/beta superfamily hydrolase